MTPSEEFDEWMKKHNDSYVNNFGVLFRKESKFIFVDSPWPGHSNAEVIGILLLCHNCKDLYDQLSIETAEELSGVQTETFLNLFYAGQAIVFCTTGDKESLQFEKVNDTLFAIIDGAERGHEVKEQLLLPGDFIRYTKGYFSFIKDQQKE